MGARKLHTFDLAMLQALADRIDSAAAAKRAARELRAATKAGSPRQRDDARLVLEGALDRAAAAQTALDGAIADEAEARA